MTDDYRNQTGLDEDDSIFDIDNSNNEYSEETAAETAPLDDVDRRSNDRIKHDESDRDGEWASNGIGYGILALVLSIIAFFFLPIVMGAAGIIIGFIARSKGAGSWGGWGIGVGIAAIAFRLSAFPFF